MVLTDPRFAQMRVELTSSSLCVTTGHGLERERSTKHPIIKFRIYRSIYEYFLEFN